MKRMNNKLLWGASLAILLCMGSRAFELRADQWDKKTVLTVNNTIQIPGTTLTPGKYIFRLMDSSSNRHIVQVFNEENHVLATILAIPNYRLKPTGSSEFGFWEMPKDTPPALRSWFYPGDNFGQEFSYPKSEATQLSAVTHQEVPSISDEEQAKLNEEMHKAEAARPAPATEVNTQTESREFPKPPTTTTVTSSDQPKMQAKAVGPSRLPDTASPLPLIGLLGCFSMGLGLVFRRLRSRR
jgi:hypothetical protein